MSEDAETTVRKIPCEVYSRVVGYLRPVSAYNIGKRQEFKDRKVFDVKELRERPNLDE